MVDLGAELVELPLVETLEALVVFHYLLRVLPDGADGLNYEQVSKREGSYFWHQIGTVWTQIRSCVQIEASSAEESPDGWHSS